MAVGTRANALFSVWLVVWLVLASCAAGGCRPSSPPQSDPGVASPIAPASSATSSASNSTGESDSPSSPSGALRTTVPNVKVYHYDRLVLEGTVDVAETIERIRRGESHAHHNDGSVFSNREGRLPSKRRGYYREYVHPTPGIGGAGPQRVVVGEDGEWYYTPDHYETFVALHTETSTKTAPARGP